MSAGSDRIVRLGEVCGVYGVKGWVKVHSFTDPRTNLFDYPLWLLDLGEGRQVIAVESTQVSGKHLLAKLQGIDDRDQARELIGTAISIQRDALPPCAPGEYYWADLIGLRVVTNSGVGLGTVEKILATGANDVLVLDGGDDKLIPFVPGRIVTQVDLDAGTILVDWDPGFWE